MFDFINDNFANPFSEIIKKELYLEEQKILDSIKQKFCLIQTNIKS